MAVRALAHLWVRIIYAIWYHRTPYQRETFTAAQQRQQRRAA
jgi:hypothetical protein